MTASTLILSVEESRLSWLNTDFISIVEYLFFLFKIFHYPKVTHSIPKDLLLQMSIVQYFPLLSIKLNLNFLKISNIYSLLHRENTYLFKFYIHLHKCKWLCKTGKAIKNKTPKNPFHTISILKKTYSDHIFNKNIFTANI